MARSRSRSGACRRVPVSEYCGKKGGGCRKSSRRRRKSRRSKKRSCACKSKGRRRSRRSRRCGKSRRRRSRRSRSCRKRSCKGGKLTINPFLNYLRVYRKKHCGWPQTKIAIEGARCWCQLTREQRNKFYKQACSQRGGGKRRRKKRRSRKCGKRRRSRRRRRRGKRSCPH